MKDFYYEKNCLSGKKIVLIVTFGFALAAFAQEKQQCMDRLIFGIQNDIPGNLQDCSVELGKNIAMSKVPFKKVPPEDIDPSKFMPKCVLAGITAKYPIASKFSGNIESFMQTALSASMSGGMPDMPKLLNSASDMGSLLSGIEKALENVGEAEVCREEREKRFFSLGFRVGLNFPGKGCFQGGLAFDWALNDWLHLQPNAIFIVKSINYFSDSYSSFQYYEDGFVPVYYIEFPILISFKISAVRLNVGPYYSIAVDSEKNDYGISLGGGFGRYFYLGVFYDYGLADVSNVKRYTVHSRKFGFNLGYNQ